MSDSVKLRPATLADSDAVYILMCELKQVEFDRQRLHAGFASNLENHHLCYQLALLNDEVVGMIGLHLQFHLHHVNWVGEIQELVVMPQVRGLGVGSRLLAWAGEKARIAGAELTELSTGKGRLDAHRFYQREGYQPTHVRFTKPVETPDEPENHA